jgi:hypothetical protein
MDDAPRLGNDLLAQLATVGARYAVTNEARVQFGSLDADDYLAPRATTMTSLLRIPGPLPPRHA